VKDVELQKDAKFLFKEESYAIRGACFEVYKEMGPGFLEAVYQECLAREFARREIPFSAQKQLGLSYKGEPLEQTYVPDFICHDKIIVEIKGVKNIAPEHRAQLLNYLKATGIKLGFLVNFGHYPQIEIERMARSC
jgi:GxxExxY protein